MLKLCVIANQQKPNVTEALKTFIPWLEERAQIVQQIDVPNDDYHENPNADLVLVLGGDGTFLAQARKIVEWDTPIIGLNFGKIGFITEFSVEDFKESWEQISKKEWNISERVMLKVRICLNHPEGEQCFESLAMNDCVITAGEPFRMIKLQVTMNHERWGAEAGTTFSGDGLILATPTGSTAYNLSAGGPILQPDVFAYCVTPICPYSISFKPVVAHGKENALVRLLQSNEGSTLVIDGQEATKIPLGSYIDFRLHEKSIKLVTNPKTNYWKLLAEKLHWATGTRNTE